MFDAGVLEISAPVLVQAAVTDLHLDSFEAGDDTWHYFLQTSPEYALKRLLAGGSGPVYALGPVFRRGESGARHNPEFTLLEWYQPGYDLDDLMTEVASLVVGLGLDSPVRASYGDLFEQALGVDPHRATPGSLVELVSAQLPDVSVPALLGVSPRADRNTCLDLLFTRFVEPGLETVLVYDYPASAACLAEIATSEGISVARRFELYAGGMELANGYLELRDAAELRSRFEADAEERRVAGKVAVAADERLLAALEAGLPPCAGVALGVERLLMALGGARSIDEVIAFAHDRA